MSKKFWLVTGGSVLTIGIGVAVTVFTVTKIKNDTTPTTSEAKVPETFLKAQQEPKGDQVYTDSSGFTFKYPKEVTVRDTTPDDTSYYTQLSIQKDANIMLISVRDSKTESTFQKLVGAVQLGGLSAKQYNTGDRLITTAYDQGVLYVIDAPNSDPYLSKAYEIVLSSFSFTNGNGKATDAGAVYEEETIE